jgi:hypothetical protein
MENPVAHCRSPLLWRDGMAPFKEEKKGMK